MRIIRHIATHPRRFDGPVLTLGNFDGVHRGHRAILARVVSEARRMGGEAVAMTFAPHPIAVLRPERAPAVLTCLRHKAELIAAAGIDVLLLHRFTHAFAQLTPEEFVDRFVVGRLGARKVVVGYSVTFGHDRRGNATVLRELGARAGFEVEIVGPVQVTSHVASSSAVRRAIAAGDMPLASDLLGRDHRVVGRVARGHRRGVTIGFPTANVRVRQGMYPPNGVYAVIGRTAYGCHGGVANIGHNPTFGDRAPRTLEVHLFDFDGDLYGQRCDVAFVERLRSETRFPSAEALAAQIQRDAEQARAVLARRGRGDGGGAASG